MSVTAPAGFRAAGVVAGLKSSGRPDVALVVADRPASVAGVLTTNRVQAAPVQVTREVLAAGLARAVVLNSGGANACTGPAGLDDARAMAREVAAALGCSECEVAVASTGLIGTRLPMSSVRGGISAAVEALSRSGGDDAAAAIMTTDTVPKQASRSFIAHGVPVTVGGMAKGAGMLAPALATMLVMLTTDADIPPADLDAALRGATETTFDRVDADGCQSTNDTVLLLASGASGARVGDDPATWRDFVGALQGVCADLADQLVDDAEGASKRIEITVGGARDEADALAAARAIARSALFKCAMHGEDPNWGRVMAALGTTSAAFDPEAVAITFNGVGVCLAGVASGDPAAARSALAARVVEVGVDLGAGDAVARVLTTDLTAAYVHENSAYST